MAGASLFALIDDIATILDDVSVMTKVAAKKTAGVLGDDLALNAQQVSGVNADRELPVVWAVAKGSAINKLILVPAALLISVIAPWAIIPLLMFGGLFLCFEGVEKLYHNYAHADDKVAHGNSKAAHAGNSAESHKTALPDITVETEADKIKGAVRTDFVLSAEIIVITLGTVATAVFMNKVLVLTGIAIIMTVGVYGLVAGIVKLDDGGLYLAKTEGSSVVAQLKRKLGFAILAFAPYMMKTLSVVGTAAMFLVGGAILVHGIPVVHHLVQDIAASLQNGILQTLVPMLLEGVFGVIAGIAALIVFNLSKPLVSKLSKKA